MLGIEKAIDEAEAKYAKEHNIRPKPLLKKLVPIDEDEDDPALEMAAKR